MLRRRLLRWLAAFGVVPWRSLPAAAADVRELSDAERKTLRALGSAVLPRALGRQGQDAIVGRFLSWLRSYRAGGCRMGSDPQQSVCDSFGRTHDHDNLFLVGAPTLPTGGCTNGTLTFAALTLRSAEAIA